MIDDVDDDDGDGDDVRLGDDCEGSELLREIGGLEDLAVRK